MTPSVSQGDVNLAKTTIQRSDELDDALRNRFEVTEDGWAFFGTQDDLRAIRSAMRDYEKNEAAVYEEKSYYDARLALQFIDVRGDA